MAIQGMSNSQNTNAIMEMLSQYQAQNKQQAGQQAQQSQQTQQAQQTQQGQQTQQQTSQQAGQASQSGGITVTLSEQSRRQAAGGVQQYGTPDANRQNVQNTPPVNDQNRQNSIKAYMVNSRSLV